MAKKLLSVIIAGLMVLSVTAFTASAEEEVIDETSAAVEETAADEEAPVEEEATTEEEAPAEEEAPVEEEITTEEEAPTEEDSEVETFAEEEGLTPDYTWYGADATEYIVGGAAQLLGFSRLVNGTADTDGDGTAEAAVDFYKKTVKLAGDVDLDGIAWEPIGKKGSTFRGTFDGQGFTVKNVTALMAGYSDVGFFGFTTNGEVKNFTIENATIEGYLDVGVVAGCPYTSKYTDITVKGDIKVDGFAYVGGAFGKNAYANITNVDVLAKEGSYVRADSIDGSGAYRTYVGGLVGFMGEGKIVVSDCDVKIDVKGSYCDIGGILGILHYGNTLKNCTFIGNLTNGDENTELDPGDDEEFGALVGTTHTGGSNYILDCTATVLSAKQCGNDVTETIRPFGAKYNRNVNIEHIYSAVVNGKAVFDSYGYAAEVDGNVYKTLPEAVAAAEDGDTVKLISDVTLAADLGIGTGDMSLELDLGGYTVDGGEYQVYTAGDGTITIHGGTIKNNNNTAGDTGAALLIMSGSKVVLEDIDVIGNYEAISNHGNLTVKSAEITGTTFGVGCFGGGITVFGAEDADNSGIVVYAKEQAIATAAAYTPVNNEVIVYGGSYKTAGAQWDDCPIYAAGHGIITVYGGEFETVSKSQACGIYVKNGIVNIKGGAFNARDGIKIGAESGDCTSIEVNITGGTFEGARSGIYAKSTAAGNGCTKYVINVDGGTFIGGADKGAEYLSFAGIAADLKYTAGTFNSEITKANIASGYYLKDNEDGTYTVTVAEAKVIDTASTTGAVVTLENLEKNDSIDASADATYKVVVESAPADEVKAANDAIKANADTNDSKAIFDISVVKVDSNGTETDLGGTSEGSVKNQKVTITLGETPDPATVKAYHVDDNSVVTKIDGITVNGKDVSFIAPSFSTYAFTYTAAPLAANAATKSIGVAFKRVADTSEYNIVLKSLDAGKVINRFMSADLTFKLDVTSGAVDYSITPAANVNLVDNNKGRYEFNIDGLVLSGVTAEEITIGSVVFDGYGAIKFGVKDAATNEVNAAEIGTNLVDTFTTAGDGATTGKLVLNDDVPNDEGTIDVTFKAPTKNLTINVAYNNKIENQKADYQAMTITVNGGDLTAPIVKKLGSDKADVTYDDTNSVYTVEIADTLTQNTAYTVIVEGQGYRTARYTVTMNANKTLNFWNDVKVSEEQVEEGNDASKSFVNFLAGEIVKDGQINLYDLSAVVSYFGTLNNVNAESAFAKYDLNRDGKIDSRDVAYVLVSWGK